MQPIHIGIDARLIDGEWGGVQQFVIGLANGLSNLLDSDREQYTFFTYENHYTWLQPYIANACQILPVEAVPAPRNSKRRFASRYPWLRRAWHQYKALRRPELHLPNSHPKMVNSGIDLIHFPFQTAAKTTLPNIYHPWDLQHLHLPQFFTPFEIYQREVMYRAYCKQASLVSVASDWARHDLMRHYQLPPEKISVVPMASVLEAYQRPTAEQVESVKHKFSLPDAFIFYPAKTWPHKNHEGLLQALRHIQKAHGVTIPVVLSGSETLHQRRLLEMAQGLDVRWVGYVSPLEVQSLYQLARALIFPSRFEGWGLPLTEAMHAGTPIACSNVTSLPEQVGNAALLFEPDDIAHMADAIYRLWSDETCRQTLIQRGFERVNRFTWDYTARSFRAQYRFLLGQPLTDEDRQLLAQAHITAS